MGPVRASILFFEIIFNYFDPVFWNNSIGIGPGDYFVFDRIEASISGRSHTLDFFFNNSCTKLLGDSFGFIGTIIVYHNNFICRHNLINDTFEAFTDIFFLVKGGNYHRNFHLDILYNESYLP